MSDPFPADRRAGMTVDERLRDADITPTTDAARAFRLGYGAGRASMQQPSWATIIDAATHRMPPR